MKKSQPKRNNRKEELVEINKMREELGMRLIMSGDKQCLRCKKNFMAEDTKTEYYCPLCKEIKRVLETTCNFEINGVVY